MPHWMEAIHNEIPEEERDELKITLKYGILNHVIAYPNVFYPLISVKIKPQWFFRPLSVVMLMSLCPSITFQQTLGLRYESFGF